jgi:hypothetical protein
MASGPCRIGMAAGPGVGVQTRRQPASHGPHYPSLLLYLLYTVLVDVHNADHADHKDQPIEGGK